MQKALAAGAAFITFLIKPVGRTQTLVREDHVQLPEPPSAQGAPWGFL